MRIEKVEATPVNIPLEAPYLWSVDSLAGFSKVIIQMFTDDGLVGLGEAPSTTCLPVITEVLGPKLWDVILSTWRPAPSAVCPRPEP